MVRQLLDLGFGTTLLGNIVVAFYSTKGFICIYYLQKLNFYLLPSIFYVITFGILRVRLVRARNLSWDSCPEVKGV